MTKTKRPQNKVIIGTAEKLVQQLSTMWAKSPVGSDRKNMLNDAMNHANSLYMEIKEIFEDIEVL